MRRGEHPALPRRTPRHGEPNKVIVAETHAGHKLAASRCQIQALTAEVITLATGKTSPTKSVPLMGHSRMRERMKLRRGS
jgi:hypothetical protein